MDASSDKPLLDLWVQERHKGIFSTAWRVKQVLFSGTSEFQQVDVVETHGFGRMLLNDGLAMLSERDEFVYHDMISHVPLFTHPDPKSVLIIGGGDGGTAREVLRHSGVERVHMVEIDGMVVDACRKHIPRTAACLDAGDPRFTLTIGDGVSFVADTDERFDVVLVDSTDPIGPATPLFGTEFYGNVHRILTDDGIVVSQGESPFFDRPVQKSLLGVLGEHFPVTLLYNFSNLTYPGGLWSFTWASKRLHPIAHFADARPAASGLAFRWYNPWIHKAAFALPTFVREELDGLLRDGND